MICKLKMMRMKSHCQYRRGYFVCLFELMFYVAVNSKGHVGTLPPFYGTFIQHYDVMTLKI